MSAIAVPTRPTVPVTPAPTPAPPAEGRPWLFTKDQFYSMVGQGFFDDARVELIGGEVIVVAGQSNLHMLGITKISRALERVSDIAHYWVRVQGTLDLSPLFVPDPDLAVVTGAADDTAGNRDNPTTALLVVEVIDTTLWSDRNRKASLYAAAGIEEYWILNIPNRQLEIRRTPPRNTATATPA